MSLDYFVTYLPDRSGCRVLRKHSSRGQRSQLLQYAQLVGDGPILHDPALGKSNDTDLGPFHLLTSRGNPAILTPVSGVPRPACRHLLALGDLIVNRNLDIGERGTATCESLLERVASDRLPVEHYGRSEISSMTFKFC